jgi:hypothetical protein
MNRKLWKSLGIAAVGLAVVVVGLIFTLSSQAQGTIPPPGTACFRPAKMSHIVTQPGGTTGLIADTTGSITAVVGQPISTPDGRQGFTFQVADWNSAGSVPGLGDVSMTLDTSRTPETSTFIANSGGSTGAASTSEGTGGGNTQRINIFINVDVDGRRYRSAGQVTLLSTDVQAFPPPPGTVYELACRVRLIDSLGKPAFDLPPGYAATIL